MLAVSASLQLLQRWEYPLYPPQQLASWDWSGGDSTGVPTARRAAGMLGLALLDRLPQGERDRLLSVVRCGATGQTSTVQEPFHVPVTAFYRLSTQQNGPASRVGYL